MTKWDEKDIEFLTKMYHKQSDEYLACIFCVPVDEVKQKAHELNLERI